MTTTPKTPKDAISEGIAALTTQLEAGNSAALTAHLAAMGRFHSYSWGNQMLIARQMPTASRVAGFHSWKSLGRSVKKGEKAIRILAPMVRKKESVETGESAEHVFGFRGVCVFDVSQTEGDELPGFAQVSGEAGDVLARLLLFAESKSIAVEYDADIAPALGLSYGGKIGILAGMSAAESFTTLAHELGHELLHKGEGRGNKRTRELEAEAVAFIVGTAAGLEMSTASADYIKLYSGNSIMLRESLEAISGAARERLRSSARLLLATPAPKHLSSRRWQHERPAWSIRCARSIARRCG
jgi:hypothetical protein